MQDRLPESPHLPRDTGVLYHNPAGAGAEISQCGNFRHLIKTATQTRCPPEAKNRTSRENATAAKDGFSRVYFQNVRLLLAGAI